MRVLTMKLCLPLAAALLAAGCQPSQYRQQADRVAYDVIGQAQKQSLGRAGPFTIDRPADALRRKLLLDQNLPTVGPESLGAGNLRPVAHWPEKDYPPRPEAVQSKREAASRPTSGPSPLLALPLAEALQIAARNSREYQSSKEDVFRSALALDLEANDFRNLLAAGTDSTYSADHSGVDTVRGMVNSGTASWQRRLENGTRLTSAFAVDLVNLLSADRASSMGLSGDATITVPLLRGSGRHIVTEPLTQAERDVTYSLLTFERFKQTLAVRVASDYLGVLQQLDQIRNAEDNYRGLIDSTRRARRLADAGRLPQLQVDQALQDELRARDRWVAAREAYQRRLDQFKITLGLPADAQMELDRAELVRLAAVEPQPAPIATPETVADQPATAPTTMPTTLPAAADLADAPIVLVPPESGVNRFGLGADAATRIALQNRLDLRIAVGQVYDAQRRVVVAADALGAELTLNGSASAGEGRGLGSAASPDAHLRPFHGVYLLGLAMDLPLERTAERNAYRNSLLALERATRDVQGLEDQVKLQVRDDLRALVQAGESHRIQLQAVMLAKRRVDSTGLFLQAGRAQIRDVLEAQEALVSAQNALTAALVTYRLAELELQRDMGVLEVDEKGNWHEYNPKNGK